MAKKVFHYNWGWCWIIRGYVVKIQLLPWRCFIVYPEWYHSEDIIEES